MRTKTTKELCEFFYREIGQYIFEILDPAFLPTKHSRELYYWVTILKDWDKQKFRIKEIFEEIANEDILEDDGTYWQFKGGFEAYQKKKKLDNKLIGEICKAIIETYIKYTKELKRQHLEESEESKQFNPSNCLM